MSHHEFPYPSDFISINGSRMHYVDSGSHEQPVVVMLHGNYSWSYGYRHFLPHLLGAGFRCVVPDHIGFGRSDKPEKVETYTFAFHCANLDAFIKEMGLKNVVIVGWEWGGAMALNYATTHTDNLQALVLMNPGLFLTTRNS